MMPRWRNLWCQLDRGRPCDRPGKRCFVATTVIVPKLGGIRLPQAPGTDHRAGAACRPSGRCRTSPSSAHGKMDATHSVSGAGCRPSGQGRMLHPTVVAGTRLFQAAGADRLPCRLLRALNKCPFPAPDADYRAGANVVAKVIFKVATCPTACRAVWNMDGPMPG